MDNIQADSIRVVPHIAIFDELAYERLNGIDITPVLVNMIDTVPTSALAYLAEQFDVLGYKGMKFADTEEEQRDLIKYAIELHRYKGTPWAVKESLKSLGITDVFLVEGVLVFIYDGTYLYDGFLSYGETTWATFRAVVNISAYSSIPSGLLNDIKILINEYKNARSHLIDVTFKIDFTDLLLATDDIITNDYGLVDTIGPALYYSGVYPYSGIIMYDGEQDVLVVNIL